MMQVYADFLHELRMAVKEVICEDDEERLKYEPALVAITVDESLKRYCQRINRPDFWGGESELLVLSKLCGQPITVYIPEHEHTNGGRGSGFIPIAEYGSEFTKGSRNKKPRKVLQKALEVWDLQVIPLDSPVAEPAQIDPELENAFICHLQDHWFCIRKVSREWYNFDSLYAAPLHLSKFYLSAYLDTLKGSGWSIFLVRGNFPKECPISSSEASNGYGQWLSPEDAERITKSCNSTNAEPQGTDSNPQSSAQVLSNEEADLLSEMEDEDLKAAIAASLLDSTPSIARAQAINPQISSRNPQDSIDNPQNNARNLQDITDKPQNSIGNPQDSNDNPQNNTRNLKDITDNPQNSIGNPQDSNDNPQNNTRNLKDITDNPQNSIGNPQDSNDNPQNNTRNLKDITDNPQNSIGNPQDSNDNPQNNTRNLKDITDNPQNSIGNPQDSNDNPQNNTRNLKDITDNPQNSIGNPQDSNDNPQNNTRNLKDITDNPQNSIGNPQDSNDNPQNNTDLQDSTDNPQNSIGNPQNISGNPQISTGNPQNESAGSQVKID
ncbi:hypothetical protein C1H46_030021 [Malus baccata]|uniref:ubiquitinyl hydrolase 1 n=1 Tax=Malus baccata TaxID=106549 RepID=A0A540LD90_MALBA|nr:hypothetical protein C1H46_030021 [Malus baccata]